MFGHELSNRFNYNLIHYISLCHKNSILLVWFVNFVVLFFCLGLLFFVLFCLGQSDVLFFVLFCFCFVFCLFVWGFCCLFVCFVCLFACLFVLCDFVLFCFLLFVCFWRFVVLGFCFIFFFFFFFGKLMKDFCLLVVICQHFSNLFLKDSLSVIKIKRWTFLVIFIILVIQLIVLAPMW